MCTGHQIGLRFSGFTMPACLLFILDWDQTRQLWAPKSRLNPETKGQASGEMTIYCCQTLHVIYQSNYLSLLPPLILQLSDAADLSSAREECGGTDYASNKKTVLSGSRYVEYCFIVRSWSLSRTHFHKLFYKTFHFIWLELLLLFIYFLVKIWPWRCTVIALHFDLRFILFTHFWQMLLSKLTCAFNL